MLSEKSQDLEQGPEQPERVPSLSHILQENIRTIVEHRKQTALHRSLQERIADKVTDFSGHMGFVALHIVWFVAWPVLNSGWFGLRPFDPFPYGLLTMIVSLEAIFLSTFVLISQNRMSEQDQQRAELDLQINLLTERELTRVLIMLDQIEDRLGIDNKGDTELSDLEKETRPEDVLKEIEREEWKKREKKPSV